MIVSAVRYENEVLRRESIMGDDWEVSNVGPGSIDPDFFEPPDVHTSNRCPFSILVLALFQICRGIFIAGVVLFILLMPNAGLTSKIEIKILTFIFARQNLSSPIFLIVLPLSAIYLCVTGFELWRLKKWARNVMMLTSGSTVLMWGRRFYFDYVFGRATLPTALQQQSVYAVMVVNVIIFFCLAAYSDVFKDSR